MRESVCFWLLHGVIKAPIYLLQDIELVFLTVAFLFAFLGLLVHPFFFCIHLLDMINKSKDLKDVFKAMSLKGRSILLTAIFGAVVVWIYSIIGYSFASHQFVSEEDIKMCNNLGECFVSALTNGLREGDIGKIMQSHDSSSSWYVFDIAYQFSYYVIIVTVMLNLIFGIIVDTFGQLREHSEAVTHHLENNCFICHLDRFTLDTKGNGFQKHIKEEHNLWDYFNMIVYLYNKDHNDYTGWEQHVMKAISSNSVHFLPTNRALALNKQTDEVENKHIHTTVQQLMQSVNMQHLQVQEKLDQLMLTARGGPAGGALSQGIPGTPRGQPDETQRGQTDKGENMQIHATVQQVMRRVEEQLQKKLDQLTPQVTAPAGFTASLPIPPAAPAAPLPSAPVLSTPERPQMLPPSADAVVLMRAWLYKRGLVNTAFKRRWMVLTSDRVITWYTDASSTTPRGSMAVGFGTKITSEGLPPSSARRHPFVLELTAASPSPGSRRPSIDNKQSRLDCEAETEAEKAVWVASLKACSVLP